MWKPARGIAINPWRPDGRARGSGSWTRTWEMHSVGLSNHALFFKINVLRWEKVSFATGWSSLEYAATHPDHQQFLLAQRSAPNQHFFLLFHSDKTSHGDSWKSRKSTSFLIDQTNIYIKNHAAVIVWITGLLNSCLRVACSVLRESEHNYWYIAVSEWRIHLASASQIIFRPCLICKYNNSLCFASCEQVHYLVFLVFRVYLYFTFERLL